ncbi:MAG: hypothetical protein ABIJ61_05640, partial [bacterium]
ADDELAALMHIHLTNNISEAIVENTLILSSFSWTGMIVDADRKILGPWSVYGDDVGCDFMKLGGADGSIQENRVFETKFDEEAVSTIKIFELASDLGIPLCTITPGGGNSCGSLNQPWWIDSAVVDCVAGGSTVIIPQSQITYYNWTGTGWICMEPAGCGAGYMISGGQGGEIHDGGATVDEWEIDYSGLHCLEPVGEITVEPAGINDYYFAGSQERWVFEVPTLNYWGKDEDDQCVLLQSPTEYFICKYTINQIAMGWGPGVYTFSCGSNTSDCGCGTLEKEVTIFDVEVTEVGFTNDFDVSAWPIDWYVYGKHHLFGWDTPVWTNSGRSDPACYTKNTAPSMFATLTVSPAVSPSITSGVSIKVSYAGTEIASASGLRIMGSSVEDLLNLDGDVDDILGSNPLPNSNGVRTIDASFMWELSLDGGSDWDPLFWASGPHRLHFINSTPVESPLYDLALEKACEYVDGSPNIRRSICEGIYDEITYNPQIPVAGHPLYLAEFKEGQCDAHARLMSCLLGSVGLSSSVVFFWGGCEPGIVDRYKLGSGTKPWWGPSMQVIVPAHPDGEVGADPHFTFHAIVESGGSFYDPSYGNSAMSSLDDIELKIKTPAGVDYEVWNGTKWVSFDDHPHLLEAVRQTGAGYPPWSNHHRVDWQWVPGDIGGLFK